MSVTEYFIASNDCILVTTEFEVMWKKTAKALFKVLSQRSLETLWKPQWKLTVSWLRFFFDEHRKTYVYFVGITHAPIMLRHFDVFP
jgi:hypothetical protein